MQYGMIGLGKMGANMVRRIAAAGHQAKVFDLDLAVARSLADELSGVEVAASLSELFDDAGSGRTIWLMVPHTLVDETLAQLRDAGLSSGDVVVDGGNSNYRMSQQRYRHLAELGIDFVDCGTSGGVWGLQNGYSLMVGGESAAVSRVEPLLKALAPSETEGWGHVGPAGAGHFVKMVHNGIEYGMMQAFAEGLELLHDKPDMPLDLQQITGIWQHGSVVRSWLLDLLADAFEQDAELSALSDFVDDSGEGRWTIEESIAQAVPAPVLTLALQMRFRSRQQASYAGRVLNALRAGFGGHPIKPASD